MPDFVNNDLHQIYDAIGAGGGGVTSFAGRVGAVVPVLGDYTTDLVTEATNLYFTEPRVYSSIIAAWAPASGVIAIGDTLQTILQKLQGNISAITSFSYSSTIPSWAPAAGVIAIGDSLQTILQKLQGNISAISSIADWTSSFSSATQATSGWTATNAGANVNAAIVPKGTGGIIGAVPNGAASGGNSRGANAVDLQTIRGAATNVAASSGGSITGGRSNGIVANATDSHIGGGDTNTIGNNSASSVICGGSSNIVVNSSLNFLGGGLSNTAGSQYGVLGGGASNTINAFRTHSVICGGNTNDNSTAGNYHFVGGGSNNSTRNTAAVITGGASHVNSQQYGFIGAGQLNVLDTGTHGTISGGYGNDSDSTDSTIVGGRLNQITNAIGATCLGGQDSLNDNNEYALTYGGDAFDTKGDNQLVWKILKLQTTARTSNQPTVLGYFLFNSHNNVILKVTVECVVICISNIGGTDPVLGDCYGGKYELLVSLVGGTPLIVNVTNTYLNGTVSMAGSDWTFSIAGTQDLFRTTYIAPTLSTASLFRTSIKISGIEIAYN